MQHCVLLKFEPGYFNNEILNYTKIVFGNIGKLEGIEVVNVYENCIVRDSNMDIMIEMKVRDESALRAYLDNELHIAFANKVAAHLVSKVSFDYE